MLYISRVNSNQEYFGIRSTYLPATIENHKKVPDWRFFVNRYIRREILHNQSVYYVLVVRRHLRWNPRADGGITSLTQELIIDTLTRSVRIILSVSGSYWEGFTGSFERIYPSTIRLFTLKNRSKVQIY